MSRRMETTADVLIVGAGSAGCVLAARLSEDPRLQVTLLEAGEPARNPWIDIPLGYFKTVGHPRHDWRFETEAEAQMQGRHLPWPRGKGLGGTSLINGMLYLRGHRADYDQWAALGNPGWDWQGVLPYFERAAGGDAQGQGPLWVSELPRDVLSDAFIAAAGRAGIPPVADFNTGDNHGAGYFRMTTRRGRRMSTARAYLAPARGRPNLRIITGAQASRIRLAGTRAVGVEVLRAGQTQFFAARHEVIVSAGAVQSPQLLQLSGIGAPQALEPLGLAVRVPLPGVGQNLQDHLQVRPVFRCVGAETLNDIAHSPWRRVREGLKYALGRSGALNAGVYRAGAFLHAQDGRTAWPDAQVHFGLVSFDRPHQPPHPFSAVTLSACLLRPESRGAITLRSADPLQAPLIRAGYLTEKADRTLAVQLVRKMREIAAAQPLAALLGAEVQPGGDVAGEAALLDWVRARAGSIFHPVGTCAMGPEADPMAVLDARLRVRGTQGLRVVDGSAMPRIVSGNTNAPIIMMAEKASDLVRADLAR